MLRGFVDSPTVSVTLVDVGGNSVSGEKYISFTAVGEGVGGPNNVFGLTDTDVTTAGIGDVLTFDGINWINVNPNYKSQNVVVDITVWNSRKLVGYKRIVATSK